MNEIKLGDAFDPRHTQDQVDQKQEAASRGVARGVDRDDELEAKKLTDEYLLYARGKFQAHLDDAMNAVTHYRAQLETLKRECRDRKRNNPDWDEKAIKREIDKLVVLARAGVYTIEELLQLQQAGVDLSDVNSLQRVEAANFKPEAEPNIIIPE